MRKSLASASILAGLLLFSASCGDERTNHSLTGPQPLRSVSAGGGINAPVPGTCTTQSALEAEINAVVPPGHDRGQVHGDVGKLESDINKKDIARAQALAFSITKFVMQLYKAKQTTGTTAQVAKLINDIYCYSGLSITISDPANSSVVSPTDPPQVVVSSTGTVGTNLPTGAVTEPTVLEFVPIPDTFGGGGNGPLHTKLDQYGGFVAISSSSATGAPLAHSVVIGVCPPPGMDAAVRARLRLGHDASAGFEITLPGDASFLTCPTSVGAASSKMPGWLKSLASLILPKPLYARMPFFASGGVGGTAGEFSPFDPVDPVLSFSGGVGGTAGEFQIVPVNPGTLGPLVPTKPAPSAANSLLLAPGPRSNTVVGGVCTAVAAVWGEPLEAECRPGVALRTHLGRVLTNVPISWAVGMGGGVIAAETSVSLSCGAFATTAYDSTDANGKAGICWTMGPTPGTNTVIATPHTGGDVPAGVTFVPATETFTATAFQATPTVAITCPATVLFNTADQNPCTAAVTGKAGASLGAATVTYGASTPHNVGTYTADAAYAGSTLYTNAAAAQKSFQITQAVATLTLGSLSQVYDGTPKSATVTTSPAGLTGVSLTYNGFPALPTNPGSYAVVASLTNANYTAPNATGTLVIGQAPATITLGNLGQTYDGNPKSAAATTDPASLTGVSITYNGTATPPTNAGSYAVVASLTNANYAAPIATGALVISQAPATITLSNLSQTYDGTPKSATATTGPAGLTVVSITYNGLATPPTNAGSYAIVASLTNANYQATNATGTLVIGQAPATITLSNLTQTYDGTPKSATATTNPAGLSGVSVLYSGSATPSTNGGNYVLFASLTNANYAAPPAQSSFNITPAATVTNVSCPPSVTYSGAPQTPCSASVTGPGLNLTPAPTYTANTDVGTATASYTFSAGGNYFGSTGSATFQIVGSVFSDGFETESGWTATGFWNRSTLLNGGSPIVNTLFPKYVDAASGDGSNGVLPSPFAGSYAFWYGNPLAGNYIGTQQPFDADHSGGISTSPNSGTLTSPPIAIPTATGVPIKLRFNTWWEIESVNPSSFDIMQVSVQVVDGPTTVLGVLNPSSDPSSDHPASTPLTTGGFDSAPVWVEVVQDLSAFRGKTVRLVYSFNTIDVLYNGFRGWVIDNIRVAAEPSFSASMQPLTRILGRVSQQTAPPTVTLQPVPPPTTRPRTRQRPKQ
jgi:hypothetical protein